jgi:hypothetical protein
MPSRPSNVHRRAIEKFSSPSGRRKFQRGSPAGFEHLKARATTDSEFFQAAETVRAAAVASSSNAVEISRMLMTPIRL